MKLRPLHDRVLVRRVDEDEKTSSGIIIPDTAKEKPMEGKVLSVGRRIVEYTVSLDDGAALAWLYDHGEVLSRVDKGLRAHVRVGLDAAAAARFESRRAPR